VILTDARWLRELCSGSEAAQAGLLTGTDLRSVPSWLGMGVTARLPERRRLTRAVLAGLLALVVAHALTPDRARAQDERAFAYSIELAEDIEPPVGRALARALKDAEERNASLMIIRLDTPGGRIDTMRSMVRDIVGARLPVIVYVHPSGGRADSAGVPLTLAGDVAAMAPATNIGSATPVWDGPAAETESEDQLLQDLQRKSVNSIVALVRTLAEDHGRNANLAERMIREATNVSAGRARRERLIDVVAPTEEALLRQLDGFAIKGRKARTLRTADLPIRRMAVDVTEEALPDDMGDESSLLRSFVYAFGAMASVSLMVYGVARARRPVRRWRRMRHRRKLMRR